MSGYFEQNEDITCLARVKEDGNELIVYNDNIHTFDYVCSCIETICLLTKQQAASCTQIIHYKGLCAVKHGSFDELNRMCEALIKKRLKAEVR